MSFDPEKAKLLTAEAERWQAAQNTTKPAKAVFAGLGDELRAMVAQWPKGAEIPYERTPEGERMARFKATAPEEFVAKIDRAKLKNPAAFDRVANWDGRFPGPLAVGDTSFAKTRAAWSALGRLYVRENRSFMPLTARSLIGELQKAEERGASEDFFWRYKFTRALLVDDVDKINWQFDSHGAALFAFYDWVYAKHIPCISTTNKDRAWWAERTADAFARRLFAGAHFEVRFNPPATLSKTETHARA